MDRMSFVSLGLTIAFATLMLVRPLQRTALRSGAPERRPSSRSH